MDKKIEETYGKPDSFVTELTKEAHTHFFERKSASEFGCRDCYNRWPDGGKFRFTDGHYIGENHL